MMMRPIGLLFLKWVSVFSGWDPLKFRGGSRFCRDLSDSVSEVDLFSEVACWKLSTVCGEAASVQQ